jgi:hypothetical protein
MAAIRHMQTTLPFPPQETCMAKEIKHFMDEADIGSGEKNMGQREIEREVQSVRVPRPDTPGDGRQMHDVVEEQKYADEHSTLSGHNLNDAEREKRMSDESAQPPGGPDSGGILKLGTHIARVATAQLPDGSFEAQVYVRLEREPEIAETYIPAGTFPDETEAWKAAEERARRALEEREF